MYKMTTEPAADFSLATMELRLQRAEGKLLPTSILYSNYFTKIRMKYIFIQKEENLLLLDSTEEKLLKKKYQRISQKEGNWTKDTRVECQRQ